MLKFVGFIFGLIAGPLAAAWLYGGSMWGPGFAPKETAAPNGNQFKLSSEAPVDRPVGDAAPTTGNTPPRQTSDQSPPPSGETGGAPAIFNTGGNPNVEVGAGPNWGYGFRLGQTPTDGSNNKRSDLSRPQ